jgi:hypothetical protein
MSVASVFFDITTAGGTLTANQCFAGVWDANGALCGLSADQSTAFALTGLTGIALVGGSGLPGAPFLVDTPYVYVGYWFNGTTGPFLSRTSIVDVGVVNGTIVVPTSQARAVTANAGLTVIGGAPLVLGTLTKATNPFWCALA